jgi:hypothetical protein
MKTAKHEIFYGVDNAALFVHLHLQCLQDTAGCTLQGLHVALEQPCFNAHPQVLCAAARVCKAWREAVQQCSFCNTSVVLDASKPLPQMQGFVQWLSRHAGLVRSISTKPIAYHMLESDASWLPVHGEAHLAAAQGLLQLSVQAATAQLGAEHGIPAEAAAAAAPAAAAAAAGAAATAAAARAVGMFGVGQPQQQQQQQQQQRGLRLRSFNSHQWPAQSCRHAGSAAPTTA